MSDWQAVIKRENLENCTCYDHSLAPYTSFRIGGRAEVMVAPRHENELRKVMTLCRKQQIRPFLLGGGSNLLISKEVLPMVLCFRKLKEIRVDGSSIYASAGTSLPTLVRQAMRHGLEGPEVFAGIPGTVGGALAGNAGGVWEGKRVDIGSLVREVKVLDRDGHIHCIPRSALRFDYRRSNLTDYIIVGAVFQLAKAPVAELRKRYKQALLKKKQSQPLGDKSAGCTFKNPPGASAWRLICQAGLAGKKIGAAMVSRKHANFIVNLGGACASEVLDLIQFVQTRVKSLFGIDLCLEVKVW